MERRGSVKRRLLEGRVLTALDADEDRASGPIDEFELVGRESRVTAIDRNVERLEAHLPRLLLVILDTLRRAGEGRAVNVGDAGHELRGVAA